MKMKLSWGMMLLAVLMLCGCSVAWKHRHNGRRYKMTSESIEYHKKAMADVGDTRILLSKFPAPRKSLRKGWDRQSKLKRLAQKKAVEAASGDVTFPEFEFLKKDLAPLSTACEKLQNYASKSPKGNGFTSAGRLLSNDGKKVCGRQQEYKMVRAEATAAETSITAMAKEIAQKSMDKKTAKTFKQVRKTCASKGTIADDRCGQFKDKALQDQCAEVCLKGFDGQWGYKLRSAVRTCVVKDVDKADSILVDKYCSKAFPAKKGRYRALSAEGSKQLTESCRASCTEKRTAKRDEAEELWKSSKKEIAACRTKKEARLCKVVKKYLSLGGLKKRTVAKKLITQMEKAEDRRAEQEEKAAERRQKAAHDVTIKYKKCMSDIDLSRTARRYAITDRDVLYRDYMEKASKRCKQKAGCSRYPDEAECEYKSGRMRF